MRVRSAGGTSVFPSRPALGQSELYCCVYRANVHKSYQKQQSGGLILPSTASGTHSEPLIIVCLISMIGRLAQMRWIGGVRVAVFLAGAVCVAAQEPVPAPLQAAFDSSALDWAAGRYPDALDRLERLPD